MSRLHRPKAGFWIRLCVLVIYPVDTLLFRIRWRNLDRIPPPESGPVIVAMNHVSIIDTLLMARLVWQAGRVPRFLIKASVFHWPVVGRIVRGGRHIPVYRGTSDAAASLSEAVAALDAGEAVVIYPEGTITRDPQQWPMQAKTGIARLVMQRPGVPVVPVGQWGAQRRSDRPWWRNLRRRRVQACVGTPLDLSRYRGREPTAQVLRAVTDEIMSAVRDQVAELRGIPAPARFYRSGLQLVDRVA